MFWLKKEEVPDPDPNSIISDLDLLTWNNCGSARIQFMNTGFCHLTHNISKSRTESVLMMRRLPGLVTFYQCSRSGSYWIRAFLDNQNPDSYTKHGSGSGSSDFKSDHNLSIFEKFYGILKIFN